MTDRMGDMVERYGEVCTRQRAAKILGCSSTKVRGMLADGRLDTACEGTMVDVRSIARYIEKPKQMDYEARVMKSEIKSGREWSV